MDRKELFKRDVKGCVSSISLRLYDQLSERAAKPGPVQISWARQYGPSLSKIIRRHCYNPYYQSVQPLFRFVPRSLKIGKLLRLSPSSKGGDTLDCYRPISILPCLSKVFESQVNKQITDHFESPRPFSAG